jgi:choline kinase
MSIKHIREVSKQEKVDVIIPSAGLGRRMKSYGPKSLIEIKKNLNIITWQLRLIHQHIPYNRIILVCGFGADILMKKTPDDLIKIENENYETSNVVRSIGMGLRAAEKDVMVIYGDLVFNAAALKAMNLNKSSILTGHDLMKEDEIGCTEHKSRVEHMMYELDNKWGQISFFRGKELKLLKSICWNRDNQNMFGFEAINEIVSRGGRIRTCGSKEAKAIDIDSSKDINLTQGIIT